ncbi:uncharacterized protein PgNI_07459 [Pyricularia grisea]|uniref:Uncharacterized protein n=1 Tax=Pyricularia grisea TaxID=148305 RepID=A0A6P8B2D1_PYRGI|nr:uncharacterized protein PgNI_07459 [Pyricularia grisea]TLD08873.1 hypothetical protein PgNI_07459 [Pyricularia grisea]
MLSFHVLILGALATFATAQQITLTPTTIRGGACPITLTSTIKQTQTVTSVSTTTSTSVSTVTAISTSTSISTVRQTITSVATVTRACVSCPTLTATATACRTCLVPGCTTTVAVSKPCGCDNLSTTSIDLGCDAANVCNRIGCKTVYDIKTAAC